MVRSCLVTLSVEAYTFYRNLIVTGNLNNDDHIIFIENCPGGEDYLSPIADNSLSVGSNNEINGNFVSITGLGYMLKTDETQ